MIRLAMDFLNPNHHPEHATVPLHRRLRTMWSEFSRRIPNFSASPSLSLSTYEIKRRMLGIPVYEVSNYKLSQVYLKSEPNADRKVELYFVSKADAGDLLHAIHNDQCDVFDRPLTQIVKCEKEMPPIRLVPEISQVKNAIELKNKDRNEDTVDLSFSGVPVFQTDCLKILDERTGKRYSHGFLRKEDLEKHMVSLVEPENRSIIKVSSFEDIIQNMKDNTTSKSNDIIFVGPGITSWTWFFTDNHRA